MIRYAMRQDIPAVNLLRAQVGEMHARALPDLFKPGFPQPMQDYAYHMLESENTDILVCEREGTIRGFAVLEYCRKEESPAHPAQEICYIHEFGVDETCRRQGIARELMTFIRREAAAKGFRHLELDMWEFNQNALAFYEAMGFQTIRRYMSMNLEPIEENEKSPVG